MLSRLAVKQKLSLLLVLPLTAVVFAIVPFAVERLDSARAADAAAANAQLARQVGALIRDLQQERTLTLAYLLRPDIEPGAVVALQRDVNDDATTILGTVSDPDVLSAAAAIQALGEIRQQALRRDTSATLVSDDYHGAVARLLDALHLDVRPGLDAADLRQMIMLDALLRSNEAASQVVAELIIASAAAERDSNAGGGIGTALTVQQQQYGRFLEFAGAAQKTLLANAADGLAGRRVTDLAGALNSASAAGPQTPPDLLSLVLSYGQLRQIAQDRIGADVADRAEAQATTGRTIAAAVTGTAGLVLVMILILTTRVSHSIASPLRRLARAAGAVADIAGAELMRVGDTDESVPSPPKLAAITVRGQDEIGELGAAINRVQATAALMLERQVTTQTNVAVMFTNIAYRTQTLVARQVALIDDMERAEPDSRLLSKLYRLDHVTARLRRSADSLLVVSGTRDTTDSAPAPLVDVIRAATAEIEGFQAIELGRTSDVVVAAELAGDLRLLLAELLENATSFSPPGAAVEVSTELVADWCAIRICDRGIGMSAKRLHDENQRMLERPRLDVAPTEFLGLFVVGRLARRHGLTVFLAPTAGGGVTASVEVPARLLMSSWSVATQAPSALMPATDAAPVFAAPPATAVLTATPPIGQWDPQFQWFRGQLATPPAINDRPDNLEDDDTRMGLRRRNPGSHMLEAGAPRTSRGEASRLRDAADEAAQLDAFTEGTQRALSGGQPPHHSLVRRIPGAQLDPSVRRRPAQPTAPIQRDPYADRDSVLAFLDGLARADDAPAANHRAK